MTNRKSARVAERWKDYSQVAGATGIARQQLVVSSTIPSWSLRIVRARGVVDAESFDELFCSVKSPRKTENGSDLYVIQDRSGRNWKKIFLRFV